MTVKIVGIGLNKTGTTTLAAAGRELGWTRGLSCRRDLLIEWRRGECLGILEAVAQADLCEDWPYPLAFREILEHFGDTARYVLTLRSSPQVWLDSLKKHAERVSATSHCRLLAYGYAYPHGAEQQHLDFYRRHADAVRTRFEARGAGHLLLEVCWETEPGWERLCPFLGVPVPAIPFPHENRAPDAVDPDVYAENLAYIRYQKGLLGAF
jgi:hypothetical protein